MRKTDVMLFHRQKLILVNVLKTPLESIRGDYPTRGSLQYEFDTELLQTPVQLLKTSSPVPQVSCIGLKLHPSTGPMTNMENVLVSGRWLTF